MLTPLSLSTSSLIISAVSFSCRDARVWSDQGETKVPGGLCRQCVMGPGERDGTTHCSNCGVAQAPHQWVMVAVHDQGCQRCARWYTGRAGTSLLWATESKRRLRMRGLIRSLIPASSPIGSEMIVTAVLEALHGLGDDKPLVPDCRANLFSWGWLPAVVASAVRNHPQWPPDLTSRTAGVWQMSAQQLQRHQHLLTDRYWADVWAWRQICPDTKKRKMVELYSFWTFPIAMS